MPSTPTPTSALGAEERERMARYADGASLAALAREHLWRDVTGFLAYLIVMKTPLQFLPWKFVLWLAPSVGDWSERDARWTFAFESPES